jgi:hypothetical protein
VDNTNKNNVTPDKAIPSSSKPKSVTIIVEPTEEDVDMESAEDILAR